MVCTLCMEVVAVVAVVAVVVAVVAVVVAVVAVVAVVKVELAALANLWWFMVNRCSKSLCAFLACFIPNRTCFIPGAYLFGCCLYNLTGDASVYPLYFDPSSLVLISN